MKRLPNKTFQNIDTVFWQLFYIVCYSQLIFNQMEYINKVVDYFGKRIITNTKTSKELGIYPYDDDEILVEFDNDKGRWYKLSWCSF